MGPQPPIRDIRTLAALPAGSSAEIRYIVFDGIREACEDAGLRQGDVVLCRDRSDASIVVEMEGGTTAAVDRAWARFIEVDLLRGDGDPGSRTSTAGSATLLAH